MEFITLASTKVSRRKNIGSQSTRSLKYTGPNRYFHTNPESFLSSLHSFSVAKKLSHTSFQIFLKVALTYPLLIIAYIIFMAVFLLKAISLPRKPRSQASRSGLMGHVQTPSRRMYSSWVIVQLCAWLFLSWAPGLSAVKVPSPPFLFSLQGIGTWPHTPECMTKHHAGCTMLSLTAGAYCNFRIFSYLFHKRGGKMFGPCDREGLAFTYILMFLPSLNFTQLFRVSPFDFKKHGIHY